MIAVAIVAILASLAYASYEAQIVKTRRTAATACLMEHVQYMERYYTTRFTYAGAVVPTGSCVVELTLFYTFGSTIEASAYTLSATPKGSQASGDARCKVLSITDKGVKGKTGTASVHDCW